MKKEIELTEEQQEFLEDISELSEKKQNGIIAYIKNREEGLIQKTKEKKRKQVEWLKEELSSKELNQKAIPIETIKIIIDEAFLDLKQNTE